VASSTGIHVKSHFKINGNGNGNGNGNCRCAERQGQLSLPGGGASRTSQHDTALALLVTGSSMPKV
jgi:hypothetical protein